MINRQTDISYIHVRGAFGQTRQPTPRRMYVMLNLFDPFPPLNTLNVKKILQLTPGVGHRHV